MAFLDRVMPGTYDPDKVIVTMTPRDSRRLSTVLALVLIVASAAAASAQSLADVARAEQSRRKEQPKPSKVYTNDSVKTDITQSTPSVLPGDGSTPASSAEAAPAAGASASTDAAGAKVDGAAGERRDQAYWKGRMTTAREQLERSKTFADALQSRVSALTLDFVNRDDPAQQSVIAQNRVKAVAELERVQREIAAQTKAIAAIEDEARKAGVPPGWLR